MNPIPLKDDLLDVVEPVGCIGVPQSVPCDDTVHRTAPVVETVAAGVDDDASSQQIVLYNLVVGVAIEVDDLTDLSAGEVRQPPTPPIVSKHRIADHRPGHRTNAHVLERPVLAGRLHVEHGIVVVRHVNSQVLDGPGGSGVVCVDVARFRRCVRVVLSEEDGDELGALADKPRPLWYNERAVHVVLSSRQHHHATTICLRLRAVAHTVCQEPLRSARWAVRGAW